VSVVGLSLWLYGRRLEKQHARGVQAIVAELGDSDPQVRVKAATTLWGLIDRFTDSERPVAEQALRTSAWSDEEGWVRNAAAASLGQLGDVRALNPLRELVNRERKGVLVKQTAKEAVARLEYEQTGN
jgi:HEAT repeat protein